MNLKQYVLTALAVSALTMPWAPGVTQAVSSAAAATAKTVKADAPIQVKQAKYSLKFNAKNYTKETLKLEGQDVHSAPTAMPSIQQSRPPSPPSP